MDEHFFLKISVKKKMLSSMKKLYIFPSGNVNILKFSVELLLEKFRQNLPCHLGTAVFIQQSLVVESARTHDHIVGSGVGVAVAEKPEHDTGPLRIAADGLNHLFDIRCLIIL